MVATSRNCKKQPDSAWYGTFKLQTKMFWTVKSSNRWTCEVSQNQLTHASQPHLLHNPQNLGPKENYVHCTHIPSHLSLRGSSPPENEILLDFRDSLGFCLDTPYHACPKEIRDIIYVSTRIYVLPVPCPRACFHPKSTSTGSTEQVHVQAVHVCMLWAAVGVWVKSWAL